ncbi:MAG TPA: hypothetical protein GXZ60_07790, partial [Intrasporangiaceae bacterium]|nr:hypothetical protein [Intrasporangiaceae bacterium]
MRIRLDIWIGPTAPAPRPVTVTVPEQGRTSSAAPTGAADPGGDLGADLRADVVAAQVAATLGVSGDAFCVGGRLLDADSRLG